MKLGFALKKTKKSGFVAAPSGADGENVARAFDAVPVKKAVDAERVYVTDFDPNAIAPGAGDDGRKKSTLVIPLLKTNEWHAQAAAAAAELAGETESAAAVAAAPEPVTTEKDDKKEAPTQELTEDEAAARQLLADVQAQQNGGDGERKVNHSLVIPMKSCETENNDPLAEKRAKLFSLDAEKLFSLDAEKKGDAPKSVPILQQNAVPGMDELADVTEKYRHDVALRPDELDVHSEAYDSVPIEDFGAAMLRGMGWKGTVEDDKDADEPKPRQKLLGLGATAKPKLPGDAGKNGHSRSSRPSDKPRSNGLNQKDDAKTSSSKGDERRDKEGSRNGRDRERERERSRSRDRDRDSRRTDRDRSSKTSDRAKDDRRLDRTSDRDRDRGRDSRRDDRDRSKSRDRDRDRDRNRDRRDDRDHRDDRDKRKRSRSRDRSSDRKKKSSSRR